MVLSSDSFHVATRISFSEFWCVDSFLMELQWNIEADKSVITTYGSVLDQKHIYDRLTFDVQQLNTRFKHSLSSLVIELVLLEPDVVCLKALRFRQRRL